MIKVENINVFNFKGALRGLRNPLNSWDKSDSVFGYGDTNWGLEDTDFEDAANAHLEAMRFRLHEEGDVEEKRYDEEAEKIYNWLINQGTSNYLGYNQYSEHCIAYVFIGPKDISLMERMTLAGTDESKFLRQIFISMDITAPLSW